MVNKTFSFLLALILVFSAGVSVFAEVDLDNPPTQPQVEDYHDNDKIKEYNEQVDEYNEQVTEHNNQVDKTYENDCAEYEKNKAAVETNNTFVDNVETKINDDSSEARGFEDSTTSSNTIPGDWSGESENLKTIQIEKSDTPTGKTIKAINLHVYLKEDAVYNELDSTFYDSIENDEFNLSDNIKNNAALVEWEIASLDYDDTVTLTYETNVFAGNTGWIKGQERWFGNNNGRLVLTNNPNIAPIDYPFYYFFRAIDGYTQGYWTIDSNMDSTTATEVNYGYSGGTTYTIHHAEKPAISYYSENGILKSETIMVRTTDKQEPKNIFTLFTYAFVRLASEPEKQELPDEPTKGEYFSYLDKLDLFDEPVPTKESTPVSKPVATSVTTTNTATTTTTTTIIATTNPPTTTIEPTPAPKAIAQGSWALINLIATILSCIIAIGLLFIKKKTEEDEPTDEEKKDIRKMKITKIASILIGIVSIVIFILTEDMSLPMVYIDKWTILMCIFTIIEILNIVIMRRQSKENENETPE